MKNKYVILCDGKRFAEVSSFSKDAEEILEAFFNENQVVAEYWDTDENGDVVAVMWTGRYTIKPVSQ